MEFKYKFGITDLIVILVVFAVGGIFLTNSFNFFDQEATIVVQETEFENPFIRFTDEQIMVRPCPAFSTSKEYVLLASNTLKQCTFDNSSGFVEIVEWDAKFDNNSSQTLGYKLSDDESRLTITSSEYAQLCGTDGDLNLGIDKVNMDDGSVQYDLWGSDIICDDFPDEVIIEVYRFIFLEAGWLSETIR